MPHLPAFTLLKMTSIYAGLLLSAQGPSRSLDLAAELSTVLTAFCLLAIVYNVRPRPFCLLPHAET